uniref:Uncharacterized protein n=1 Tax=Magallana gigas TaxID=29159 RepID=A0A8W8LCG0_MAGGI
MRRTASVFMIWNAICVYVDSCTFPSVLEGKTWEDSDKGQPVTFSGSDMLGWNVSAFSTVMTQWECLFNQNDIIVSKSSFVFGLPFAPPVTYYVYICMWIVSLDSDKFIYYLLADFISDLNTRAYRNTEDNLGPCDVCKLSLSLVPADAKVMTSTGSPSEITIPPQSGPCKSTGSNQAKEPADGFNKVFVAPIVIGISVLIAAVVSVILFKFKKRNPKTVAKKINVCTA